MEKGKAKMLYETVGENYRQVLVEPELASTIKGFTAATEASALYTGGRSELQTKLLAELKQGLGERGVIVEQVLLRSVKLPETLTASIELKAKAEQESIRMQYVLTREKQEAQRKAIEAQGIADFQKIVSQGISPRLLKWKGVCCSSSCSFGSLTLFCADRGHGETRRVTKHQGRHHRQLQGRSTNHPQRRRGQLALLDVVLSLGSRRRCASCSRLAFLTHPF